MSSKKQALREMQALQKGIVKAFKRKGGQVNEVEPATFEQVYLLAGLGSYVLFFANGKEYALHPISRHFAVPLGAPQRPVPSGIKQTRSSGHV